MLKKTLIGLAAVAVVSAATTGAAYARDQIRVVGSSTVFPFSTVVAEEFGKTSKFKTPIVESTGTGGGMKLFCAGAGVQHPDITNASRRIKKSELEGCNANGVAPIEVKIGFDGIVVANTKQAKPMNLTLKQLFLALGKQVPDKSGKLVPNPYKLWSDVDPSLPKTKIEVMGPPPTSGTRDAFNELAMEGGCKTFPKLAEMKKADEKKYEAICRGVREDGAYIEGGENDNLIVQKLVANPNLIGVFGYSFLEENADKIQGGTIDGVAPDYDDISSGKYPVSRSLYFYVKKQHVGAVPGIKEYVAEFVSDKAVGPNGYAADKGLIALPDADRKAVRDKVLTWTPMTGDEVK